MFRPMWENISTFYIINLCKIVCGNCVTFANFQDCKLGVWDTSLQRELVTFTNTNRLEIKLQNASIYPIGPDIRQSKIELNYFMSTGYSQEFWALPDNREISDLTERCFFSDLSRARNSLKKEDLTKRSVDILTSLIIDS